MSMQPPPVPVLLAMGFCLCGFAPAPDEGTPLPRSHAVSDSGHPVVITSDSRAFCERLVTVIDAYGPPLTREVHDLRIQGAHLCREGRVRSGIVQLRRALMVLKEDNHS
ncbi:hypothetical protein [Gluconacetobacter diazotrophicus]|nr:hypothetical protein [Gluconacetobacter diazotrophicus]